MCVCKRKCTCTFIDMYIYIYHTFGGADHIRIWSDTEVFDAQFFAWCSDQAITRSDTEVFNTRLLA